MAFRSFNDFTIRTPTPLEFVVGFNPLVGEYRTQISTLYEVISTAVFTTALLNFQNTYTITTNNSANWNLGYNAYTYLRDNSANWEETATIAILQAASASWNSVYQSYNSLSATYLNVASAITIGNSLYLKLSGGTIDGNLTIENGNVIIDDGNLTVFGIISAVSGIAAFNTNYLSTTAISAINFDPDNIALNVWQTGNSKKVAQFKNFDNNTPVVEINNAPAAAIAAYGAVSAQGNVSTEANFVSAGKNISDFFSIGSLDIGSLIAYLSSNTTTLCGVTILSNLSVVGSITASDYFLPNSSFPYESFNTDGITTTFTLASAVGSINDILVFVSGIYQRKDTYTLLNNHTLQLTQAPPAGTKVLEVSYIRGSPLGYFVPAPNSVITSSIANGAVTFEKLSGIYTTFIEPNFFTGDGTTTIFTLASAVANSYEIDVHISGVYQNKNTYTIVAGSKTLTFSEAPGNGANIEISYQRSVPLNTIAPATNTVTTASIVDGAVTTPKIADAAVTDAKLDVTNLRVKGDLTVVGTLSALSGAYFVNTQFTVTSALSVVSLGQGPALYVLQGTGPGDIASFYDADGVEVLHVGNALNPVSPGVVGIMTSNPEQTLTVAGTVSAQGGLSAANMFAPIIRSTNVFTTGSMGVATNASVETLTVAGTVSAQGGLSAANMFTTGTIISGSNNLDSVFTKPKDVTKKAIAFALIFK